MIQDDFYNCQRKCIAGLVIVGVLIYCYCMHFYRSCVPGGFALFIAAFFLVFLFSCVLNSPKFDEEKWRRDVENQKTEMLYASHYDKGRFFNPWMPMKEKGFPRFLRWKLTSKETYTDEERAFLPGIIPRLRERIAKFDGNFIAWIGHGTFLIRSGGEYWLTDPMFSERALLPKRLTPAAMTASEFGEWKGNLNVVISHNHYDHFDEKSIRDLPAGTRFFVPLGLKEAVHKEGQDDVTEMDWWETKDLPGGIRIVCLPSQHWSRRISQGINRTLWASWLVITPDVTIYYGGDSGYFIGYREIGRKFPGIDYALIPVSAYQPRWFMHYSHVDPKEALDAFRDLGARYFIPTQWGTFPLGNEPAGYPMADLRRVLPSSGIDAKRVLIMDIGQIIGIEKKGR